MRGRPGSVRSLEEFGRVRLSASFFMRDFLHSEIADFHGIPNIPDDPELAIAAGRQLCKQLLEPLQATFGRLSIRSAYRAPAVNEFGNRHGLSCASNLRNYGRHIWDHRDITGAMGAMATVVVPWFADCYRDGSDWRALAWWVHDHLPYSQLQFFPKLAAFNIGWHEQPRRRIDSFIAPKGCLTRPGMTNHNGSHGEFYPSFPGCEKGKRLKWQGARVPSRRCGRSTICLITPALAGAVNWSSSGSQRLAPLRLADQDREGEQSLYRIGREGRAGWRGGGGASLTAFGAELLERYNRILDRAATNAVDDLAALARRAHPDAGVAQRTRSSRRDAVRRDYSRPCPLRQDVPFLAPD